MKELDSKTLYTKNKDGSFSPAAERLSTLNFSSYRYGQYLLNVGKNSTTLKSIPPTNYPEVEAALLLIADELVRILHDKASEPSEKEYKRLNKEQLKAFEVWKKAFGTETVLLPSKQEIVDACMKVLRENIIRQLEDE